MPACSSGHSSCYLIAEYLGFALCQVTEETRQVLQAILSLTRCVLIENCAYSNSPDVLEQGDLCPESLCMFQGVLTIIVLTAIVED